MLSLSDLSGRCGASTSIGPYFGTKAILSGSSRTTRPITTNTGVTAGWPELRRLNVAAYPHHQSQNLSHIHIPGGNIAKAYFKPQLPPELEFDTDRLNDAVVILCVGVIETAVELGTFSGIFQLTARQLLIGAPLSFLSANQSHAPNARVGSLLRNFRGNAENPA
jgi:hypothetical protein